MRTPTYLVAVTLIATPLCAQVPTTLNYQGRLLENTTDQDAVGGTVDIDFSIWTELTGGTEVWSESWTGIPLSNGIFSVVLGSNGSPLDAAIFQADASLYLELEVDGETLSPRQMLGAAPFAMVDDPRNELQDLELTGDTLSLSEDATSVDLSKYLDDTDDQDLSLAGDTLVLENDATGVDLSGYLDNTDAQTLSLAGDALTISGSGSSVDLSAATGTDALSTRVGDLETLLTRTVFVTSGTYVGTSFGGVAGADAICQTLADAAALEGVFLAWLSDSSVSPATRFDRLGRFELVDGTKVADDWSDLTDGSLDANIPLDEAGNVISTLGLVWTGTAVDGTARSHCSDWTDSTQNAKIGRTSSTNELWTDLTNQRCDITLRLYCFEQVARGIDNQVLSLDGDTLQLTSADGADEVDLSRYLDDTDTDNQMLSLSGDTLSLTSDDGTDTVDLSKYLDDTDTTIDDQVLSLSGNVLSLTSDDGSDVVDLTTATIISELLARIEELESAVGRLVFVTSSQFDGNLGGLAGADQICQDLAHAAGHTGTFLAWLSAEGESPESRFVHSDRPYKLVDGTVVADDWDDLTDESLDHAINLTEDGDLLAAERVWSNTQPSGVADPTSDSSCGDFTDNTSGRSRRGSTEYADRNWTYDSLAFCAQADKHLYCFEQ